MRSKQANFERRRAFSWARSSSVAGILLTKTPDRFSRTSDAYGNIGLMRRTFLDYRENISGSGEDNAVTEAKALWWVFF